MAKQRLNHYISNISLNSLKEITHLKDAANPNIDIEYQLIGSHYALALPH